MHQSTGRGNYFGTPLGKKLYAHAAALSPQKSFKNLEMILALNQAVFLVDSGVCLKNIDLEKIAKTVLSATALKEFVIDSATDSAFQAWDEIVQHNCKLFLLCDKEAKKTANAHFVKILCWWSTLDKKIKTSTWTRMTLTEQARHVLMQSSMPSFNFLVGKTTY
jgi:hypothetical protein